MGFNPRISPYSLSTQIMVRESSKDVNAAQHFAVFRFPFAGQIIGAYANVHRTYIAAGTADAAIEAETNTGVQEISLWKHATDDTTATYATSLRACARTGNKDTTTGGGLDWHLPTTSASPSLMSLTNKSATRRKFGAGDVVMMKIAPYGVTDAHRSHRVDLQMDYIIGEEAS